MIRFESVSLSYHGGQDVLRNVSFGLAEGSFRWLLGTSGSGKTTLLRLMNLSLVPTHGNVIVLGATSGAIRRGVVPRLRAQIGVIFQDFRLLPHLSAFDNVALPLRLGGRPEGQVRADVMELMKWMGLTGKLASLPTDISGGERQRVAIARAVIIRPRLLLADEPMTGLDAVQADRVMVLLRELNRLGSTVIIATHNETLVERYPGASFRLSQGSLLETA